MPTSGLCPSRKFLALVAPDVRASGTLTARAHVSGTMEDPRGNGTFDLTKAVIYEEPLDRVNGAIDYTNRLITVSGLQAASPAGRLDASGSFAHEPPIFKRAVRPCIWLLQASILIAFKTCKRLNRSCRNTAGYRGRRRGSSQTECGATSAGYPSGREWRRYRHPMERHRSAM